MIPSNDSIQLIPAARGFIQNIANDIIATSEQAEEIDNCKRDFYNNFYCSDRTRRIHERLANKEIFIYQWSNGCSPKGKALEISVIESLLSDRSTLFSSEYLDYQFNHNVMEQQSKIISAYGQDEACINFALPAAATFSEEKIEAFRDTLAQLLQQAHQKKKQLWPYHKNLHSLYCKTIDQKNIVALNSILKCKIPPAKSGLDPDDMICYLLDVLGQCCQWEKENGKSFSESDCKEEYKHFISNAMLNRSGQQKYILNDISSKMLKQMQREKKSATAFYEILRDAHKQAKAEAEVTVLSRIKEWYPDTRILAKDSYYFLKNVLDKCARCERDLKMSKSVLGAGYYEPSYTKQQFQEAQAYNERKESFSLLRKEFETWMETHEFPFYERFFGVEGDNARNISISDEMLSNVTKDLSNYIVNSESQVQKIPADKVQMIINQLFDKQVIDNQVNEILGVQKQKREKKELSKKEIKDQVHKEFGIRLPFRLLVLCTVGKGNFLVGRSSLEVSTLEEYKRYNKSEPSKAKTLMKY